MSAPTRPNNCISAAALAGRGWTTTAIRIFLGEPDHTAPNPFYRQAAPMRLYHRTRVTAAEHTEQCQRWRTTADQRSTRAKTAADSAAEFGRRTPSPTSQQPAGKRPEGHAPADRRILPRAAHRNQDVTTISTPTTGRHRPRGAALGAGFHLNAHATPPRWVNPRQTHLLA